MCLYIVSVRGVCACVAGCVRGCFWYVCPDGNKYANMSAKYTNTPILVTGLLATLFISCDPPGCVVCPKVRARVMRMNKCDSARRLMQSWVIVRILCASKPMLIVCDAILIGSRFALIEYKQRSRHHYELLRFVTACRDLLRRDYYATCAFGETCVDWQRAITHCD